MMVSLATRRLTKSFGGVHAVDHVSLSFEGGKITALVGPNGSGKTTFINAVTGLVPIDSGTVIVSDTVELADIRRSDISSYGITRTFQSVRLIAQLSVLDNLLVVLTERNVWAALFERHNSLHLDEAEDLLRKIGLWEKREEPAENLSYGQRKVLEIARALAMKADIYFFDEPFAGLFSEMRKTVSTILIELAEGGAAVILVEHDMALIRELAQHCFVLDSGKIIAEGSPMEVLKTSQVIEAYLGK